MQRLRRHKKKEVALFSICVGITFRFSNAYQRRRLKYGSPHPEFFKHSTGYALGEVKMDSTFRWGSGFILNGQIELHPALGAFLSVQGVWFWRQPNRRNRALVSRCAQLASTCSWLAVWPQAADIAFLDPFAPCKFLKYNFSICAAKASTFKI